MDVSLCIILTELNLYSVFCSDRSKQVLTSDPYLLFVGVYGMSFFVSVFSSVVMYKVPFTQNLFFKPSRFQLLNMATFKGIVQPKILIMLLITHPHVVSNCKIFRTQFNIFLMKSESFLTLHRQQCNWHTFKAQKGSKDIVKTFHVTSMVQP